MELKNIYEYLNFKDFPFMISGVLFLILLYTFFAILQRFLLFKKGPPGPIGLPIVGYLPFLGKEPYKTFWNLRKKYGDVISVYLGPKYITVLNNYNAVKEVFNHPGSWDRGVQHFKHLGPIGFGGENGERWVEQRKFALSIAKDLGLGKNYWSILIMEELSSLIKKLQDSKGKPYDISQDLLYSINNSLLSLLIGRRLREEETDKIHLSSEFADAAMGKSEPSNAAILIPGLRKACEIFKIANFDKNKEIIHLFHLFLKEEIAKHKTSPLLRDIPDFINSYLGKLSELSKTNNKDHAYSETMLQGNLASLFIGGSDTILSSLAFLFRAMSKYKNIQNKVHQELMEVLGKNEQARYEERDRIPYTFAVIMEGQRCSSIVRLSANRQANQSIPIHGYKIPKGSDITANLWGLHHDPAYWDEPEEFRPERFLIDDGSKLNKQPLSFAPFSFGRRKCPGESIALMEILYYFSEVLKRFEISMPPGVEPKFEFTEGLVAQLLPQPLCFKERII